MRAKISVYMSATRRAQVIVRCPKGNVPGLGFRVLKYSPGIRLSCSTSHSYLGEMVSGLCN